VTWLGTFPVYTSTLLAAGHAVTMVFSAMAMAFGAEGLLQAFIFSSSSVLRDFSVWQVFTYAFVHTPPYWLFLLELWMLVVFGSGIEREMGRRAFVGLYLLLLLFPAILLLGAGLAGYPSILRGSSALHFGVFVAFATLLPRAEIFFSLQARWVAAALVGVNALQCLALGDFVSLWVLVADCTAAVIFVRHTEILDSLNSLRRPRPKLRVLPPATQSPPPMQSIDPILEKISRMGIKSLSATERRLLERAREELLAKDKKR